MIAILFLLMIAFQEKNFGTWFAESNVYIKFTQII